MFGFGKRKSAELPVERAKPELLEQKNIRLNCEGMSKEEVIRAMGAMLCESGYVDAGYTEAMLKREQSFPTNIGNGIALPHGVEEAKKEIRRSGIAVMVFPEGVDWGNEMVKLIIGIAGVGDDHLEILSIIAEKMAEPEAVEQAVRSTREELYKLFTERGETV